MIVHTHGVKIFSCRNLSISWSNYFKFPFHWSQIYRNWLSLIFFKRSFNSEILDFIGQSQRSDVTFPSIQSMNDNSCSGFLIKLDIKRTRCQSFDLNIVYSLRIITLTEGIIDLKGFQGIVELTLRAVERFFNKAVGFIRRFIFLRDKYFEISPNTFKIKIQLWIRMRFARVTELEKFFLFRL